uniref:DUF4283 domain-containing protein n=1 Tax=Salix viminalis TaxID=40686 RepID=A0A6N2KS20_SALVM
MAAVQKPQPVSWAEKVRVSHSDNRCSLEQLSHKPAGSVLTIPKDMVLADVDTWKRSMIGFFVSYKMPYHAVLSIANRVWKAHGLEKVTVLDNGFMVFRFISEESMGEVLARAYSAAKMASQASNLTEIKLEPYLQGLSLAASMVGLPIACDEATLQGHRMEYARVCVELDASEEPVHRFQVDSPLMVTPITVEVTYEWKPTRCPSCKVFGHSCKVTETKAKEAKDGEKDKEMEKERGEVTPTEVNIEQISTLGSKAPAIPQGGNGGEEAERAKEPEPVLTAGGKSKKFLPCESVARVDKGKMMQCMEEKMDSFSGATDSVNGELEAASSSTNED